MDPAMLNYYWSTATSNDCLVAGPSGAGYIAIEHWNSANVDAYTRASHSYLQRSGMRVANPVWSVSPANVESFARNCPSLLGLVTSGGAYTKVYSGLPVIGFAGGLDSITRAAVGWNGSAPKFIAVEADAWSTTPAKVQEAVNALDKNEYVVVRPDQLLSLYREAARLPAHLAAR
jgi:hypothetical protein